MAPADSADRSGDLVRVILDQAREIAALKTELAECRDQYRALVRHYPRPTWVYCFETLRFLDVNPVAVDTYGWSHDEFLSMTIADIRPPEDVPALVTDVARLRDTSSGTGGRWRHRHKDGSLVEVTISFQTLPFRGRPARLIIVDPVPDAARAGERRRVAADDSPVLPQLSRREREVFVLVARGHTSEAIAERLGLSRKSVETYRARFMQKLALTTRADLVRYALAHKILAA